MLKVTQSDPSLLRRAGEKLQQRGYIGFFYVDEDSNMTLLAEGREYVVNNKLYLEAERPLMDKDEASRLLMIDYEFPNSHLR